MCKRPQSALRWYGSVSFSQIHETVSTYRPCSLINLCASDICVPFWGQRDDWLLETSQFHACTSCSAAVTCLRHSVVFFLGSAVNSVPRPTLTVPQASCKRQSSIFKLLPKRQLSGVGFRFPIDYISAYNYTPSPLLPRAPIEIQKIVDGVHYIWQMHTTLFYDCDSVRQLRCL